MVSGGGFQPNLTASLITTRDGIVGDWRRPDDGQVPNDLRQETVKNLELLGPGERAAIFDFELSSRIAFGESVENGNRAMSIWHVAPNPGRSRRGLPDIEYQPLVRLIRPSRATFLEQLDFLDTYADLRADRAPEIVGQLGVPEAFFGSIAYIHPDRNKWTMELIYTALRFTYSIVMRVKYAVACRRPHEYSPQVQPIIPSPLHGSWPSGHATEAPVFAHLLLKLLEGTKSRTRPNTYEQDWGEQLMRQAARIAINRTVAGVHFPTDSAAGTLLGLTLAEYLVELCSGGAGYRSSEFRGHRYPGDEDYDWRNFYSVKKKKLRISGPAAKKYAKIGKEKNSFGSHPAARPAALTWLWEKARDEWTWEDGTE